MPQRHSCWRVDARWDGGSAVWLPVPARLASVGLHPDAGSQLMRDVLAWMEASMLGELVRETGVWTYAILNLGHILGISTLFGAIVVLDLRLLQVTQRVPIAALARVTVPLAKVGFTLAVATGVAMICTNATEYVGNPFLLIKFPAILLGLMNVGIISRLPSWRATRERELTPRENRQLALMGGLSLVSWLTAVSAGRMIGYW
jgi:hypothetical protein